MTGLRQKLILLSLGIYWPTLFVLALIPMPQSVYKAQVSDKTLHFAAYLILVFLLWFGIGREQKVSWRGFKEWCILYIIILYGATDEILQSFVNRSCDVGDFTANLFGALTGLALFMFLGFYQALLVVTGIVIFLLTNLARVDLHELLPVSSTLFYATAYGFLTLLWIRQDYCSLVVQRPLVKWLARGAALPIVLLAFVEVFSIAVGRGLRPYRAAGSAAGIVAGFMLILLINLWQQRIAAKASPSSLERFV
jgi:VanZ family protein